MLLRELEVEKYWSFPAAYTHEKRQVELQHMIESGHYYYQLKTDGNYGAFVCDFDGQKMLLSRGISKTTNDYGHLEDKLFFFDAVASTFNKPTRLIGEVWLENGIDRNVGSVLRASTLKSRSIQDNDYYNEIKSTAHFTAKDKRDIETNEFRGKKLKWRVFDCWYYDGIDLLNTPWIERQKYAAEAVQRINHPLVTYVSYKPMTEHFFDELGAIFASGGEGVVCYKDSGIPEPGARTAHKTLKVKQEIENSIDCFIIGLISCEKAYQGGDLPNWDLWENKRTGELVRGQYYEEYQRGAPYEPISRNYFFNYPGAISVGVYDNNHQIVPLCNVAGLTDDFKTQLRDNFSAWYMCPLSIGGMMISTASEAVSIRHPHLLAIRKGDIKVEDCTLDKILN